MESYSELLDDELSEKIMYITQHDQTIFFHFVKERIEYRLLYDMICSKRGIGIRDGKNERLRRKYNYIQM